MNKSLWIIAATISIGLAVGAAEPVPALVSAAEQWLSYRTGDGVERLVGKMPGQTLRLTATKPEGVALPKFQAADPLFGQWKTPTVKSGGLWMALDRSAPGKPYDRLFIDTNANGSLADEEPIKPVGNLSAEQFQNMTFPPVKLLLLGPDGPVAYHLGIGVQLFAGQGRAVTAAACWYEGNIVVNGRQTRCILADANANGVFNDASKDSDQADRIRLADLPAPFAVGRVGRFIQADGKLWRLTAAPDGACVEIAPAADARLVRVTVPKSISRLSVAGGNGLLLVEPADGVVQLPAGQYRLNHWEAAKKDAAGVDWQIVANVLDREQADVDLAAGPGAPGAGNAAALDIGEPLTSICGHSASGQTHAFSNPCLRGRRNETIILTRQGQQPPPPTLLIVNADKTYEKRHSFEYG
jgi:hypothetical protein